MIGQRVNGQDVNSKTNSFRHRIFVVLYGTITEALIFAAAQILMPRDFEYGGDRAALTVRKSVSMVTINQRGAGDALDIKDGGTSRWRFPDGGGFVLVPQAGGFSVITGLIGYDNTVAGFHRLKFQHEGHTGPVPVDPRNGFRHRTVLTSYP